MCLQIAASRQGVQLVSATKNSACSCRLLVDLLLWFGNFGDRARGQKPGSTPSRYREDSMRAFGWTVLIAALLLAVPGSAKLRAEETGKVVIKISTIQTRSSELTLQEKRANE